jgi:hypothetical protein
MHLQKVISKIRTKISWIRKALLFFLSEKAEVAAAVIAYENYCRG